MSSPKTTVNDASVEDFINQATGGNVVKRADSFALLEMFTRITKEKPKMWGTAIIGFGQYHYKSERSRQEGEWMLAGFSPRKQNLSVYIMSGLEHYPDLLGKLGKHKTSTGMGSCLYINKLSDIDLAVLEKLIKQSYADMKKRHPDG